MRVVLKILRYGVLVVPHVTTNRVGVELRHPLFHVLQLPSEYISKMPPEPRSYVSRIESLVPMTNSIQPVSHEEYVWLSGSEYLGYVLVHLLFVTGNRAYVLVAKEPEIDPLVRLVYLDVVLVVFQIVSPRFLGLPFHSLTRHCGGIFGGIPVPQPAGLFGVVSMI